MGKGNAQAAGTMGSANAWSKGLAGVGNAVSDAYRMNNLRPYAAPGGVRPLAMPQGYDPNGGVPMSMIPYRSAGVR
jgi:hypothetical protein